MKTKMIAIAAILTALMVWTGATAWAKNDRGQRQRQEVGNHENHGTGAAPRHDNWEPRSPRRPASDHREQIRRYHRLPAPPVRHYYNRHYQPRRPVYAPSQHHHNLHDSGFLFGWSMFQPGLGFSIILGDRH